ncbi:MAG: transcription antitermination factor NusB [Brachymonas sp.]|jgi:N utilization substance protein B
MNPEQAPKPQFKAAPRSPRSRAREFVVQALYQHLVGQNGSEGIDAFTRNLQGFSKADSVHYDAVFRGCLAQTEALDALLLPKLDRSLAEISPCERAIMWMGVYEFGHCPDIPWRVVLNEHIELAKAFGGTDGHKYVNGVLHKLAQELRPAEFAHDQSGKADPSVADTSA